MQLLQKLLNRLNGLHYRQEYLCLAKENFEDPIHVYLLHPGGSITDITNVHLFVGYNPLIFALPITAVTGPQRATIEVVLSQTGLLTNDNFNGKAAIASLSFKKIYQMGADSEVIFFYECTRGAHHFISAFHQSVIQLNNQLYNKKKGNVFLKANLYKQVQIAYAVPRIISLVTVGSNSSFNLFPTDLHGSATGQHYVSSLRVNGKACSQVERVGRLAISEVHSGMYKTVYSLGKNHMQELRSKENFPFGNKRSEVLGLPLPEYALRYRELEVKETFDYGIHRLFLYKTVSRHSLDNTLSTLAHIHNCYATWRFRHGLPGNYLLR